MAINKRQNSLLVAENWKKIYQTFQDADFTSYDFETLRKSMIDHLRINYPEDFNDFTESSEYIALVDLIAFMGQSLAFRTDINARENFIDTAERRDSILKLARLVSYNPKRNIPASGFLKIESISTTETIYDSNGFNLSNLLISWDDKNNSNWLEQFGTVLNSALVSSQIVGKPGHSQILNSIKTDEYSLNLAPNTTSISQFQALVENSNVNFEIISATSIGKNYIYESPPKPNSLFNILYRNDSYGNSSNNTGFFVYFKQGILQSQDFSLNESLPNRIIPLNFTNINQTDVWLCSISSSGNIQDYWKEVPAISGINVIYNKTQDKNLYQINTKNNDQIDLVFGDGTFANMPKGLFRVYFRTSDGLNYKITPNELQNIIIPMNYVSRSGRLETLTIKASLKYTVINSSTRETLDDIKQKAPQQYYTQNRMITGEDYNILPFTSFGNVVKVKSINRSSSGISRYLDILDPTGKYSSTNSFADDGALYKNDNISLITFSYSDFTNLSELVYEKVVNGIVNSVEFRHFYYENYPTYRTNNLVWRLQTSSVPAVTGYMSELDVGYPNNTVSYVDEVLPGQYTIQSMNSTESNLKLTIEQLTKKLLRNQRVTSFRPAVASGGTAPYSYSINPELPKGLSFLSTGYITGVPVASNAVTSHTITIIDAKNDVVVAPFLLILSDDSTKYPLNDTVSQSEWNLLPDQAKKEVSFFNTVNYIKKGAIIKFIPIPGYHFDANNNMLPGPPALLTDKVEIFAGVTNISGRVMSPQSNGVGSVALNMVVSNDVIVEKIYPVFKNSFSVSLVKNVVNTINNFKNFGISYNSKYQNWRIIDDQNLNIVNDFSLENEGDQSNSGKDSSWLIRFEFTGTNYKVYYRNVEYVFESAKQVKFLKDEKVRVFDPRTGKVLNDQITIFKTNTRPDSITALGEDYVWYIYKSLVDADGYINNAKVLLTYSDLNNDGIPDNPELFVRLVNPTVNPKLKRIYFKILKSKNVFLDYELINEGLVISTYQSKNQINQNSFLPGQIFYADLDKKFYQIDSTGGLVETNEYKTTFGRQGLYFQYKHNSPESRRIDPGTANIIDIYVLTSYYESAYRKWISDSSNTVTKPMPPTTVDLARDYASLNDVKSVSDTIVFHSAIFKPIFGFKATSNLQATFKVVKNTSIETSDNDIKISVIDAVNNYFDISNWEFGETFYFSELSAYLHQVLVPNIASITIVPTNPDLSFGHLYQINCEPNEIIVSAATVENVEIITSLTAAQLHLVY